MSELHNNRWIAENDEFARRIEVGDVKGFFAKTVTIEPGSRALFLEKGKSLGEIPSGQYTMQTLFERLTTWSRNTATIIITRQQEIDLGFTSTGIPTSEFLEVIVNMSVGIKIDDVAIFFTNYMGSKTSVSTSELQNAVSPLVRQAIWEAIGRLSIKDLTTDQARKDIEICVTQNLGSALERYGLKFTSVKTLSISHPEYDAQRRKTGEIFLQREALDFDKKSAQLAADKLFNSIEAQEKTNDLEILAEQVKTDRMEGALSVKLRRIGVRKQLREAALAGHFDKINTEEELMKFVEQRDKERLLRQEELQNLAQSLQDKSADAQAKRKHLLNILAYEQQSELDNIRIDMNHAQKLKVRQHEIELTKLNESEQSRQWRLRIEEEIESSSKVRVEQLKKLEHDKHVQSTQLDFRREEEYKELLNQRRLKSISREIDLEDEEHKKRKFFINHEIEEIKRKADQDYNKSVREFQLAELERLNEINLKAAAGQQGIKHADDKHKVDQDIRLKESDTNMKLAEMQMTKGMSWQELLANKGDPNKIVDVMMNQSNQETARVAAMSQAEVAKHQSAKTEELQNRLSDAEKRRANDMIAQMKEAMQNQMSGFNTFGNMVTDITKNLAPGAPQVVNVGGQTITPGNTQSGNNSPKLLCPHCRAECDTNKKFCGNCGKSL